MMRPAQQSPRVGPRNSGAVAHRTLKGQNGIGHRHYRPDERYLGHRHRRRADVALGVHGDPEIGAQRLDHSDAGNVVLGKVLDRNEVRQPIKRHDVPPTLALSPAHMFRRICVRFVTMGPYCRSLSSNKTATNSCNGLASPPSFVTVSDAYLIHHMSAATIPHATMASAVVQPMRSRRVICPHQKGRNPPQGQRARQSLAPVVLSIPNTGGGAKHGPTGTVREKARSCSSSCRRSLPDFANRQGQDCRAARLAARPFPSVRPRIKVTPDSHGCAGRSGGADPFPDRPRPQPHYPPGASR